MISVVKQCSVENCYFNRNSACHAEAITVGSPCPKCDTFCVSSQHGGKADIGKVGACHEIDCRWNNDMSCTAESVVVGHHGTHGDCLTFDKG